MYVCACTGAALTQSMVPALDDLRPVLQQQLQQVRSALPVASSSSTQQRLK